MAWGDKKREMLRLEKTVFGLVGGFLLGLGAGPIANIILSLMNLKIGYVTFLKGFGPVTIGRIFLGNLLIAGLLHYLPPKFPKHKNLAALLIGTVGFVLGFFGTTAAVSAGEFLRRLPHVSLEVFAYVVAARGSGIVLAVLALLLGAFFEYHVVLK
ncbi:MAG: hypothetical protein V1820_01840 [archaeon]